MLEKWVVKNSEVMVKRLPRKVASRVMKQFSMSTAQFSVAVVVMFLFVSSSSYMASQYIKQGPLANIHFFLVCTTIFFLHLFTHIGQSIFFRSFTPGAITSIIIILPYSLLLYESLFENRIITWETIFSSFPYCVLVFPIVLTAHWIGKRLVNGL